MIYERLKFALIEEGRVQLRLDEAILELETALEDYAKEHGAEALQGVGCSVTLKIELKCTNGEDGIFELKADIQTKRPTRPVSVTAAVRDFKHEEKGHGLFVRASGSTDDLHEHGFRFVR